MNNEQKVLTYHRDKQFIRGQRIQCIISNKCCLPCIVNSLAISILEKNQLLICDKQQNLK